MQPCLTQKARDFKFLNINFICKSVKQYEQELINARYKKTQRENDLVFNPREINMLIHL